MECPIEPDQSECCNSGCIPCIFDVYEKQLQKYKKYQAEGLTVKENCLKELKYAPFKLINIIKDSSYANIYIFKCNLHESDENAACNVHCNPGQHLLIKMQSEYDNNDFTRAYTPIPWDGINSQQFAVLIKLYPVGMMSQCIRKLKIGDVTQWRGPYGDYDIDYKLTSILMIAQGTGVAPLYAIARKLLDNDECEVRMKLIYCCQDLAQVHLRSQLYAMLDYWNFTYELYLSSKMGINCNSESKWGVKYHEVVTERKLNEDDVKSLLHMEDDKDQWSEVLICGSNAFSAQMDDYARKYSSCKVFVF